MKAISTRRDEQPPEPLLLPREAAAILRIHVVTLSRWRGKFRGPKAVRVEGAVRYRASDLSAWLDAHTQEGSASPFTTAGTAT